MLADLVVDLLVAQVELDPQAGRRQGCGDLTGIVVGVRGDRGHHCLGGCQPQGEGPGVVLDGHAQEALHGPADRPVQHDRPLLGAVFGHILGIEALRQDEVQLQGAALPGPADGVAQVELQLGTIEGTFARQGLDLHVDRLAGGPVQLGLGDVPDFVGPGADLGPQGQLHAVQVQAEVGIDRVQQLHELCRLRLDLVLAAEDVGVVLGEGAQAHDAMQGTGRLVPVAGAELGHAERQVAVALLAVVEDLDVPRTVHRLNGQLLAFRRLAGEHVLAELLPVSGLLPKSPVHDLGRLDLHVTVRFHPAAHVGLHRPVEGPALGMPEDHPPGFFLKVEQVHGPADPAVVPAFGLLDSFQVGFQVRLAGPGRAVDALQLGVAVVAAPVGARQLGQFEGLAHMPGRGQVRTQAQVLPAALPVDGDDLVLGQVGDDLRLVGLADPLEVGDGLVAVPDLPDDLLVPVDDLGHPRLDGAEVIQREGLVPGEVVIEAVLDGRSDGHLGPREKLLDRLGQHVAGVVANYLQGVGAFARQDLEGPAAGQGAVKVQELAVQAYQQGALFQRLGDGGGDVAAAGARVEGPLGAVGKDEFDHGLVCPFRSPPASPAAIGAGIRGGTGS